MKHLIPAPCVCPACGDEKPRIAFLRADGSGYSLPCLTCQQAVERECAEADREGQEIWRPCPDAPLEASHLGEVRRTNGRMVGIHWSGGYPKVKSGRRNYFVHRLVARAFFGACPSWLECNHKDGDKGNSRVTNLEYVTHAENSAHAWRIGLTPPPPIFRGVKGESSEQ